MSTLEPENVLRAAGLRVTPLRVSALEILFREGRPLSHTELQKELPDADRVTLYRTLSTFVDVNIAHQVQGLDGAWRFCAHTIHGEGCPGNHPHFLCTRCGAMICLTAQRLPTIGIPDGCLIEGKQLVAYGYCQTCAKSASTKKNNQAQ